MSDENHGQEPRGISVRIAAVGAALFVAAGFFAGAIAGSTHAAPAAVVVSVIGLGETYAPPEGMDFSPVWKAWGVIDERYVPPHVSTTTATSSPNGAQDPQARVWGMVQGLAASLEDPYTVFLPPVEAEIFNEDISGNFEGVGMEIAIRDTVLTVVAPLKDSPSFRAGVKAGDKILKIDDKDTQGITIETAVRNIRGPKGSVVTLTIMREGLTEPTEIKVTRDVINIPTIETELRTDGIFVIELYNFSAVSSGLFRNALREFIESGSDKLILDLRGNPGGYLEAAVEMGSWFLPQGAIIVTEDYADKKNDIIHRSRGYNVFDEHLEMAIIVDRGSASASEILAGALQHYGIAKLVGTDTFGKGSVQELVPITPETSLKITVARWLTPGGAQIPQDGLKPDFAVKPSEEDIKADKDVQLEKAVEILQN